MNKTSDSKFSTDIPLQKVHHWRCMYSIFLMGRMKVSLLLEYHFLSFCRLWGLTINSAPFANNWKPSTCTLVPRIQLHQFSQSTVWNFTSTVLYPWGNHFSFHSQLAANYPQFDFARNTFTKPIQTTVKTQCIDFEKTIVLAKYRFWFPANLNVFSSKHNSRYITFFENLRSFSSD